MKGLVAPLVKLVVFTVVTIMATAILAISIANVNLTSTESYTARFSDATLLLPGDDVRIAGVRVGQVEEVGIVDRKQAEVTFSVAANRKLPATVTAQIKFRNLVGQRYVSLSQGGAGGDPNAVLEPGDNIPLERTRPALDLTELFNGFKPLFRALSPDDVNQLSYEIIQVLQGEGGTIDSVLAHTASLTTTIASKDQVIGQVINNLNTVLSTVNNRTAQLSGLIDALQQLSTGLAEQRAPIGEAIDALGALTESTAGLLGSVRPPLTENITHLGVLASTLSEHGDTVDKFLTGLPHKIQTINRVSSYGGWFNYYLCSMSGRIGVSELGITVDIPALPLAGTPMVERCGP